MAKIGALKLSSKNEKPNDEVRNAKIGNTIERINAMIEAQ